ncbi:MAG: ornithine cyclodeaminase [Planctomycetota bacterium]|nr:MAG: ornithine cyclodeaminase [Planctomycetota bacterium]
MVKRNVGKEILYLTQDKVIEAGINDDDILQLVKAALTEHGSKKYEMPSKIGLHPRENTLMHAMPGWVPAYDACGIKWAECFPDNYKYNLPQTSGLMILNCSETGWPICILDAIWITAKRTPAVTAVACEYLARKDSEIVGMIGAGIQGREHVNLLPKVIPNLKKIKIYDRFEESISKLISDLQPKHPNVELIPCKSFEETVRGSDVVVSATAILSKPEPQIKDEWIKEGAFIAPVDFDSLWEWKTFKRADKFLVDSLDEMNYFMGVGYLANGLPDIHAEIGEVVAGLKVGRETDDELIIDMNIGMGVEDVVIGKKIYDLAIEKGLGLSLPL